eukprot:603550_1
MNAQVLTSKEGEIDFNFETWIAKNNLTQIKDLFIKHKVTKQAALQFGSPQFMALMSDPELLNNKSSMIPRIIQALQSVYVTIEAKFAAKPRGRVVITEAEETAMDNAEIECEKTLNDIHAFTEAIENTKRNHTQCEQQINVMFESFVSALKRRQKKLLRKLNEVKQQKINAFQRQLNELKGFRKQYSDTKHKWETILYHENMDKVQRKRTIKETANALSKSSTDITDKNKAVLCLINAQFDLKMPSYESYVNTYGQVLDDKRSTKPVISKLKGGHRMVKFAVDSASESAVPKDSIYEVQWQAKLANDDEKCEWKMKDFVSNQIEIQGLSPNTRYSVRCRIKSGNVLSTFCDVQSFTTQKLNIFEIKRCGSIRKGGWAYDGDMDALSFVSNKNITLYGIGVFDCEGTINVKYDIIKGDNDHYDQADIIATSEQKSFTRELATNTPIRFDLRTPVAIQQNTKYTIQLIQQNDGSESSYVKGEQRVVTNHGVTVTFNNARQSPNPTSFKKGAFPALYCSM